MAEFRLEVEASRRTEGNVALPVSATAAQMKMEGGRREVSDPAPPIEEIVPVPPTYIGEGGPASGVPGGG